jgi:hypothetical protein
MVIDHLWYGHDFFFWCSQVCLTLTTISISFCIAINAFMAGGIIMERRLKYSNVLEIVPLFRIFVHSSPEDKKILLDSGGEIVHPAEDDKNYRPAFN